MFKNKKILYFNRSLENPKRFENLKNLIKKINSGKFLFSEEGETGKPLSSKKFIVSNNNNKFEVGWFERHCSNISHITLTRDRSGVERPVVPGSDKLDNSERFFTLKTNNENILLDRDEYEIHEKYLQWATKELESEKNIFLYIYYLIRLNQTIFKKEILHSIFNWFLKILGISKYYIK